MWTLKSAWDQYVIDKSGYREENIVAIETNWKDYGIKGKKDPSRSNRLTPPNPSKRARTFSEPLRNRPDLRMLDCLRNFQKIGAKIFGA